MSVTCKTCLHVRVITVNRGSQARQNLRSCHTFQQVSFRKWVVKGCVEYRCGGPAWTCPDLQSSFSITTGSKMLILTRHGCLMWPTLLASAINLFYLVLYLKEKKKNTLPASLQFCVGMWLQTLTKCKHEEMDSFRSFNLPWLQYFLIIYVKTAASFSLMNRSIIQSLDSAEEQIAVKAFSAVVWNHFHHWFLNTVFALHCE